MIDRFARKQKWGHRGKGPTGRSLCYCGCGEEIPLSRGRCTSVAGHFEKWRLHSDAQHIRRVVEERDRGICVLCGADTVKRSYAARDTRQLWYWLARRHAEDLFYRGELGRYVGHTAGEIRYADYRRQANEAASLYDAHLWATHWVSQDIREAFGTQGSGHTWEADHIVPVVEGGGGCGPEGYRTLCIGCHKKETKKLAARRAAKRKSEKCPNTT